MAAGDGFMTTILSSATEVLTWIITSMGSVITFVKSEPVILALFLIFLCGTAVNFMLRILHTW